MPYCDKHGAGCFRKECGYTAPYHVEDRRHMARERGNGWSYSIGAPMPQSRSEQRRIEKERGIYFDSGPTAQEKRYIEYAKHCKATGETFDARQVTPPPPDTKQELKERVIGSWKKHGIVTD